MRDLIKVRAANVTMAALKHGWYREAKTFVTPDGGSPAIRWRCPARGISRWETDDPEAFPEPLRQAKRVELICLFSERCPVCDATAVALSYEDAIAADPRRAWAVVFRGRTASGKAAKAPGVFVIEHAPDCDARPELVEAMNAAAAN
jgi:hypothetical protein